MLSRQTSLLIHNVRMNCFILVQSCSLFTFTFTGFHSLIFTNFITIPHSWHRGRLFARTIGGNTRFVGKLNCLLIISAAFAKWFGNLPLIEKWNTFTVQSTATIFIPFFASHVIILTLLYSWFYSNAWLYVLYIGPGEELAAQAGERRGR